MLQRVLTALTVLVVSLVILVQPVAAHAGSLAGSLQSAPAPFWLVVVSGGGVVCVSFLLSAFVTDDETLDVFTRFGVRVDRSVKFVGAAVRLFGVAALGAVIGFALVGPTVAIANLGVLLVWVGWWAGFTMLTYLVVDVWPLVNPWRTLASELHRRVRAVRRASRPYPSRIGAWPSVVGLLGLVWLEVVSPLAANPRSLAAVVIAYSLVTIVGAAVYGDSWFQHVDPVARVFRLYGLLAPVQRTGDGLSVSFPGSSLARSREKFGTDDVAFVVALLWVTTFDGLVSTVAWSRVLDAVAPVPAWAVNFIAILAGFLAFFAGYRFASRTARRSADTYVTAEFIAGWFAPALVPIAAGYHLAHFLGYVVGLAPVLATVALSPLSPPANISVLTVPAWFGGLRLAFVVLGHLLSVWVAHTRSFDVFPGRLQPLRSEYPFVVVTVCYTMASLWVVAQPTVGGVAG
ncbi:hypothetical protein E6P09_11660 [Haloferax mediterranei ATCC 33500]|uniref:Uncharacterized protein n=1 Tax=Haloferax mediterranei (strain ATCC 33500 / DSM 1411 / JCM 8866 / NBRC 14739 / NCIMB 2177 / R-4) TaxID=523841 RepID=I3R5C3_HALMT|nr:hypothetical protein HFX_1727 [Haloferax mediterranei ATCC 33500]AHZ21216.1 hypothetical protein BM92_00470 [Haloferax mediterranei ATCC 33500]EMA04377.1 hypothetical protein C439_01842 [Haloferax mediterranei ATCC 33500]QCQ76656.1 hypothetical protein E6P09_11660 [Haloferax mediterranei ATCC 33500]